MSSSRSPVSKAYTVMVTVTTALKAVGLFVAELISSFTDWFQTKPTWANLEVLENTELKTTGGGESKLEDCSLPTMPYSFTSNYLSLSVHEKHKAKTLWEKTGAVVMVVRRPG